MKRKKEADYLAIIVVSHLDRYVNGCLNVANDDGTDEGRPAGSDGMACSTTKPPILEPLDIEVEWKSLPRDLMYSVLRIPDKQKSLSHWLSEVKKLDDPPDFGDYFWSRRYGYAELGLEVLEVTKRLRKHAGMSIEESAPGEWSRDLAFREIMDKVSEERSEYKNRVAENSKKQAASPISPSTTVPAPAQA